MVFTPLKQAKLANLTGKKSPSPDTSPGPGRGKSHASLTEVTSEPAARRRSLLAPVRVFKLCDGLMQGHC